MLPRNLTLFRFAASPCDAMDTALSEHRVREPGPLEMRTCGFASPYGASDTRLTLTANGCTGFVFAQYERALPAAAVIEAVNKEVRRIANEEGRRIGMRERKRIKDDVLTKMMPQAPVRPRRVAGWLDLDHGWVVIDTASRRTAEDALKALREAFGSFPAVPLAPEEAPRVLMTHWLANDALPEHLGLGDECELRDPATTKGALVRCCRQDLDADEVKEHLHSGKQVFQLGLCLHGRMGFVLSEALAITKLRAFDILTDSRAEAEDDAAQRDADFALATLEVRQLLSQLADLFNIPRPAEA